jgi:hypothetical protein
VKEFAELVAAYRQLGPVRFSLIVGGTLAAILALVVPYVILSEKLGWPEAYGVNCPRKCGALIIWHSPKLLEGGSADEVLLFGVIWAVPLIAAVLMLLAMLRRKFRR